MTLESAGLFHREYFDWSEEEFAQKFVKKISGGRLRRSDTYVDLKIEKISTVKKVKEAYQDLTNLPNLVKMLPALAKDPTPSDYLRSLNNFLRDNRAGDLLHWWRRLREGTKTPLFGSADIVNICNLKCVHCYWWTNREATAGELTPDQWRTVIQNSYKKMKIANVTVVGGEPMLRKDVIKVFSEELKNRITVVTNGMFPMADINGFYFVSIDGTEEIHNRIRGPNTYARIKKNVQEFVGSGGSVAINMTLNTLNYKTVVDVLHEWEDIAGRISIQFHTPFIDNDPLWLPFGDERNRTIDAILEFSRTENKHFVINSKEQFELMRGNWGY
ncbi:MAG TPA: radical SAM protein, partial [Nitrososphaerales archaeon]|nr:radical SAM protein [Nitrososphaerales archaeon]